MKRYIGIAIAFVILFAFFLATDTVRQSAQRATDPPRDFAKVIPEVIVLGKESKIGEVTFNHVKHNGGEYNSGGPILCIECHHTAQTAAELVRSPPLKTLWPAGRTTTLTAELFAADPAKAGVAACRDCHVREGVKPRLMDAIPSLVDPGTKEVTVLTNERAFHAACDVCHYDIQFRTNGTKAPNASNCGACHKPAGKKQ
jgi:cytochrome c553